MARKWWTLIAVSVATFMLLLDITVVNTALPSIQKDLGASFTDLQWVIDAYTLALAAVVLTAGSIADRIGRRAVFGAGLGLFAIASLAAGVSPDATFLNISRAVQGIGAAAMFAVSLALVAQEFPAGKERATAMGVYGASIGVAVAIGPLVGRRDHKQPRLALGVLHQRADRNRRDRGDVRKAARVARSERDPCGLARAGDVQHRTADAGTRAGARQRRGLGQPADRRSAHRRRGHARCIRSNRAAGRRTDAPARAVPPPRVHTAVQLAALAVSASLFALFLYLTLYLQNYLGYSPLQAGLRYLPITLAPFFVAPLAVALMARVQARVLLAIGLAATGAGLLLMGGLSTSSSWTALLPGFLVAGIGVGLLNPVIADVALSVVSKDRSGMAAGINDTFRQVGISIGVAAWGAIFLAKGADKISTLTAGTPTAAGDHPRQPLEAASNGQLGSAIAHLPHGAQAIAASATREGFLSGLM